LNPLRDSESLRDSKLYSRKFILQLMMKTLVFISSPKGLEYRLP
jgi:hypothetical protein